MPRTLNAVRFSTPTITGVEMKRAVAMIVVLCATGMSVAQLTEKQVSVSRDGKIKVGPSPQDDQALYRFLYLANVQEELAVEEEQRDALAKLYEEHKSLRPFLTGRGGRSRQDVLEERQDISKLALDEVLAPKQKARLRQLAYRYEVSAVGLGNALCYGRLGVDAGIHNDQTDLLLRKSKKIEEQKLKAIKDATVQAEEKLLAELSPDQRKSVRERIGPLFIHEDVLDVRIGFNEILKESAGSDENNTRNSR